MLGTIASNIAVFAGFCGSGAVYFGMPKRSSKDETADLNELAKSIVDEATSEDESEVPDEESADESGKNPAAVALGRLGGKKGGPARAKKLTKERRSEIAREAAQKRWRKDAD